MNAAAAVIGTGFIGRVHAEALRRLGVTVRGVVGSSPGDDHAYDNLEAVLADDAVDVVHLATPNALHHAQAVACLEAGKHVVCEKPLAITAAESADLLARARRSGLVHCVNFNLRFYPQVHEARHRVARGDAGAVWSVHGSYLQDWLLRPDDTNWRVDPALGGPLRAVADIGSHWLDMAQFVSGRRVTAVLADLATTVPERGGVPVATEDLAHVLLRFDGDDGARGAVVVSQVSAGRRNALSLSVDGADGAVAWTSDRCDELWLGHLERPNELLTRDPALMAGPLHGTVPGGHAEGFQDTFKELYRKVYESIAAGGPPPERPDYPTFADGHASIVLGEAIARSHRERAWVEVPEAV